MAKETRSYRKMCEDQEIRVVRQAPGRYTIHRGNETWDVWHNLDGRWRGESKDHPGKMVDAATLTVAKFDLRMGYFVNCASAGL